MIKVLDINISNYDNKLCIIRIQRQLDDLFVVLECKISEIRVIQRRFRITKGNLSHYYQNTVLPKLSSR